MAGNIPTVYAADRRSRRDGSCEVCRTQHRTALLCRDRRRSPPAVVTQCPATTMRVLIRAAQRSEQVDRDWGVVNTAVRGQFITRSSLSLVRDMCSFMEPKGHRPSEADVCSASREVLCGLWYTKVAYLHNCVHNSRAAGPPNM